jgi:carbonic anhydrase
MAHHCAARTVQYVPFSDESSMASAEVSEEQPAPAEPDASPADGEAEETAPAPRVIRVPGGGLRGPLLYAAVGVPLLLVSFLGTMFAVRATAPAPAAEQHVWSYEGNTAPAKWAEVDPHAKLCGVGEQQSPIDIHPSRLAQVDWMTPIQTRYRPSKLSLVNEHHNLKVKFEAGSRLTLLGQEYVLSHVQVHTPSEHTISGRAAAMELQLVHTRADDSSQLAIVSVLAEEGAEHPFLARIWGQLPEKEGQAKTEVTASAQELLPRGQRFFYYQGSITTPPCTEGVKWVVMREPVTVSKDQVSRFKTIFHANARPVQPVKERYVFEDVPQT